MIRLATISKEKIKDCLKALTAGKVLGDVKYLGYPMTIDTDRYEVLYNKGCKCAMCGLEASFAAIEKVSNRKRSKPHLNVYGITENGKEVMFTKDHIYPRSLGGLDIMENYQVLCNDCNNKKSNATIMTRAEAIEKGLTTQEYIDLTEEIEKYKQELAELRDAAAAVQRKINQVIEERNKVLPPRPKKEFTY